MPSIEPRIANIPVADSAPENRPARTVVVIHEIPDRRDEPLPPVILPEPEQPQAKGRHRAQDHSWLQVLERGLSSWPVTLRLVVLLAVLLTGTATLAAALGLAGQLLLVGLSLARRRQRNAVAG
jgi:hypothetical protein